MTNFAQDFSKSFTKKMNSGKLRKDEVSLFRALIKTFAEFGGRVCAKELHGSKSLVEFRPRKDWRRLGKRFGRCELADLLIIAFRRNDVRFAFIQCKREPSHKAFRGRVPKTFAGNYEQWDLLAYRPKIKSRSSLKVPESILSSATMASVGSFVFFDGSRKWEIFYSCANNLHRTSTRVSRYGRLEPNRSHKLRKHAGCLECIFAESTKDFVENIQRLQIGTPLFGTPRKFKGKLKTWFQNLLTCMLGRCKKRREQTLLKELLGILGTDGAIPQSSEKLRNLLPTRAVIVVRADDREEQELQKTLHQKRQISRTLKLPKDESRGIITKLILE